MKTSVSITRISQGRHWRYLTAIVLLGGILGCGRGSDRAAAPTTSTSTSRRPAVERPSGSAKPRLATSKTYKLTGVVKGMSPESKEVQIRHDEIPGFMDEMTMPFTIKDPQVFQKLHPGDRVEGKLQVQEEDGMVKDYELTNLVAVTPGSERPETSEKELVVSLAGGTPTLRVKAKTLQIGEEVPDFTMTNGDGKALKLSDFRGDVVALTFVYTRCPLPDFCPLMDRKFSELAQRIERSPKRKGKVRLISVSFDPEHDTPEVLKKHAAMRGANSPPWTYAVATHEELAKVAPRLGLVYGPGRDEIMHNLCTVIVDPRGKLARLEIGTTRNKWEATDILNTVDALIRTSSK